MDKPPSCKELWEIAPSAEEVGLRCLSLAWVLGETLGLGCLLLRDLNVW